MGDIYADLLALEMDFDDIAYDVRGRWLSVTTELITLQNIYLGPFEIRLNWGRSCNDSSYRVIANSSSASSCIRTRATRRSPV